MKNISSFIYECMNITEAFKGKDFYIYTTSKDTSFEQYFFAEELRFANNAGNEYGCGIYALCQEPKDAGVGYSDGYRESLYGNNQYEFTVPADKIFYITYKYFQESPLYTKTGKPSEQEYIKAQLEYFNIKIPTEETLTNLYPSVDKRGKTTEGLVAFNFYKYMNSIYYQRKDGSLKSPITAFIYNGKNDGETAVVWNPYDIELTRKKLNSQDWEKVEQLTKKEAKQELSEIDYIFDGNKTEEKEKVYRLLVAYTGKGHRVLGQFTQICIHDDKTIDATYKSNLPNIDAYHHCYQLSENSYIEEIDSMGYTFNKLNGWLKFGQSSQLGKDVTGYTPVECPKSLIPKEITGGFYLSNCVLDKANLDVLQSISHQDDAIVIRNTYIRIDTIPFRDVVFTNAYVDDDKYDTFIAKYPTKEGEIIRKSEFDKKSKK